MKNHSNNLENQGAIIDTGVLVEYFTLNSEDSIERAFGEYLEKNILESEIFQILYIHSSVKTELLYIICRQRGWEKAKQIVDKLVANFVELHLPELDDLAAQIKCQCPLALSDCYSLAIGSILSFPVYFMKEREMTEDIQEKLKQVFSINLIVLDAETILQG